MAKGWLPNQRSPLTSRACAGSGVRLSNSGVFRTMDASYCCPESTATVCAACSGRSSGETGGNRAGVLIVGRVDFRCRPGESGLGDQCGDGSGRWHGEQVSAVAEKDRKALAGSRGLDAFEAGFQLSDHGGSFAASIELCPQRVRAHHATAPSTGGPRLAPRN